MAGNTLREWMAEEASHINRTLAEEVNILPEPAQPVARHILEAGGKRMRPLLTILCGRLLGYRGSDIYRLASSLELLHAATLLHDDILDHASSRRGQAAAHTIYGEAVAILAGDALLAHGNAIVAAFGDPALTMCFSRATMQTAAGEIMEMNCLGLPDLAHDRYLEIARGKTACLIAEACLMGALKAGCAPEQAASCASFGENLGIAFQIVDDALDFAPASQTGKPTGGDLREGKMTPPLRLYRESLADRERKVFDEAFRTGNFGKINEAEIIRAVGAFVPAAISLADKCLEKAQCALNKLPDGPERQILAQLAEYIRNRRA